MTFIGNFYRLLFCFMAILVYIERSLRITSTNRYYLPLSMMVCSQSELGYAYA